VHGSTVPNLPLSRFSPEIPLINASAARNQSEPDR
jgi:hypothetical protein